MRQGFTLIELSIVLVIIGLIVGGVLVGQDLIRAAEVRATISQLEKYNTAVNTFRDKYGGLPGDLNAASAAQFGLVGRAGTAGRGDGNGLLQNGGAGSGHPGAINVAGEIGLFWRDLSDARLIEDSLTGVDCSGMGGGGCTFSSATVPISRIIPLAKLGRGNYVTVFGDSSTLGGGSNYYWIMGGLVSIDLNGDFAGGVASVMTPREAWSIDVKIDDGYPTSGSVISLSWAGTDNAPPGAGLAGAASAGQCGNSDVTPTAYNIASSYADATRCSLSFRFQ